MKLVPLTLLASLSIIGSSHASTVIYDEDFSNASLLANGNPYLGGWFGNNVEFGEYAGDSGRTSITPDETLKVISDTNLSSAAVILDPATFTPGAGTYTLSFGIVNYEAEVGDFATVSIWAGSGYGSSSTGDALILNTYDSTLDTAGAATSELLSYVTYTSAGARYSQTFEYDGSSAIALFFGAENNNGYPFPEFEFDNVTITSAAVPEPSSLSLMALGGVLLTMRRKR